MAAARFTLMAKLESIRLEIFPQPGGRLGHRIGAGIKRFAAQLGAGQSLGRNRLAGAEGGALQHSGGGAERRPGSGVG